MSRRQTATQLRAAIAAHRRQTADSSDPINRHAALLEQRVSKIEEELEATRSSQRALLWVVIGSIVAGAIAQIIGG